jgi:Spy/CpxP family protein refolding chaperone
VKTTVVRLLVLLLIPCAAIGAIDPEAKNIFDYQTELGLSDDQVSTLKETLESVRAELAGYRALLAPLDRTTREMIAREASFEEIRAKLEEIAKVKIDAQIADLKGARKIHSILTPEQKAKWQEQQRKNVEASGKK